MENDDGLLERSEKVEMIDEPDTHSIDVGKKKKQYKKKVVSAQCAEEVKEASEEEEEGVKPVKVKKPRTEAQIVSFEKARATRDANREKSKQMKEQQTEEKVLTKALKEKVIIKTESKISKLKNELINKIIESDSEEEYVPEVKKTSRVKKSYSEVKPLITFV